MKTLEQINARKEYISLLKVAKERDWKKKRGDGLELHHILPRSIFPNWVKRDSNVVLLTKKEHSIAHRLLFMIYPCKETAFAAFLMKSFELMSSEELERYQKDLYIARVESAKGNQHFKGRHHSEKSIELIRQNRFDMTGYHHTEECKKRISEHMKGKQNSLGNHHSDETKKKISEHNYNKTDEGKRRARERSLGKTWWTNDEKRSFSKDCPGEGWYKGIPKSVIEKRRKTMEEKHGWKQKQSVEIE